MRKIAVLLNTNQLGGAERSLIEQMSSIKNEVDCHFFYPELASSSEKLKTFLQEKDFTEVTGFAYPRALYSLSRKGKGSMLSFFLLLFILPVAIVRWYYTFRGYDAFYLNGLKASLALLLWAPLIGAKKKIFWHFRDFPHARSVSFLGTLALRVDPDLTVIGNSLAVTEELKKLLKAQVQCLYNLTGPLPQKNAPEKISHIGVVSMLAPWKGVHTVILMAGLYHDELVKLGVKKISLYGSSLYQTAGEHTLYESQLVRLKEKVRAHLIVFEGNQPPQNIFSDIDLLIHPVIEPEPFGRVILEAYKSHVPVISTALGGARELLQDGKLGGKFIPYDPEGLFASVKDFTLNPERIRSMTKTAFSVAEEWELETQSKIRELLIKNLPR